MFHWMMIFRESSTQTDPYQPEFTISEDCKILPEVLILENVEIGIDSKNGGFRCELC